MRRRWRWCWHLLFSAASPPKFPRIRPHPESHSQTHLILKIVRWEYFWRNRQFYENIHTYKKFAESTDQSSKYIQGGNSKFIVDDKVCSHIIKSIDIYVHTGSEEWSVRKILTFQRRAERSVEQSEKNLEDCEFRQKIQKKENKKVWW